MSVITAIGELPVNLDLLSHSEKTWRFFGITLTKKNSLPIYSNCGRGSTQKESLPNVNIFNTSLDKMPTKKKSGCEE